MIFNYTKICVCFLDEKMKKKIDQQGSFGRAIGCFEVLVKDPL
jgi:hypothetical protein